MQTNKMDVQEVFGQVLAIAAPEERQVWLERTCADQPELRRKVEILLKAYGKGMRIKEVPFQYRPRKEGQSKSRIIHFGLDYLRLFGKMWALRTSLGRAYSSARY